MKKPDDNSHIHTYPVGRVLEVGSMIQFGDPIQHGMIKIIRKDPSSNEELAEIETVSFVCKLITI